jgi:hypothetical protein
MIKNPSRYDILDLDKNTVACIKIKKYVYDILELDSYFIISKKVLSSFKSLYSNKTFLSKHIEEIYFEDENPEMFI